MEPGSGYVPRSLTYVERGGTVIVHEDDLDAQPLPFVVLGDPGMGKTELMLRLGRRSGYHYMTAAQFMRRRIDRLPQGVLVLDAFDEVGAVRDGDPLDALLGRLADAEAPPFVLSCRAADWRGSGRVKAIAADYGTSARVLTLGPLTDVEGMGVLQGRLGSSKAQQLRSSLMLHGLSALLSNPQTLRMLSEVADGGLPTSRSDLFERASRRMIAEHNEEHAQSALNLVDADRILDGAGAAMAMLLMCGKEGVFTGLQAGTPMQFEHVAAIAALPLAADCRTALTSRLFRTTGDVDGLTDCHRTVAEYLGARWLCRLVDAAEHPAALAARVLGLLGSGGRVPASLRGLHAWLAHGSRRFEDEVIRADPYGVLRYGDPGSMTLDRADRIWDALVAHAREDPWFRAGDWQRFSVSGLVQRGMGARLAMVIEDPGSSFHLRSLVLELLPDGGCVPEMRETLLAVVRDAERTYSERHDAIGILAGWSGNGIDWAPVLMGMLGVDDPDAAHLAEYALMRVGIDGFEDSEFAETMFALCGGRTDDGYPRRRNGYDELWTLVPVVPVWRSPAILDAMVARFRPHGVAPVRMRHGAALERFVHTLIVRLIPATTPDPMSLWRWLDAFDSRSRASPAGLLDAWIAGNAALRRALQTQILLTDEGAAAQERRHWHLGALSAGLDIQEDDGVALLEGLADADRHDETAHRAFRHVMTGWHSRGPVSESWFAIARRYAEGRPALLAVLEPPPPPKGEARALRRIALRARDAEAKLERRRLGDRGTVLRDLDRLGEGRGPSSRLALCLLGCGMNGGVDGTLADRIGTWIGYDVHETARRGFEAALRRPRGAPLDEICRRLLAEDCDEDPVWPVVAALALRHEEGRGFDDVDEEHVMAALIAKRLRLPVVDRRIPGFCDELDEFVAADARRFERFLNALIEPQISADRYGVSGIRYLLGGHGHADLRTRLLLRWFDPLASGRSADLEACVDALLDAPPGLRIEAGRKLDALIDEAPPSWDGSDRTPYWNALRFVRDFPGNRGALETAAADDGFVWQLRRVLLHDRFGGHPIRPVPYDGLVWIFRRFHSCWPEAERPRGSGSGSRNACDASEFLTAVLFGIARDTSAGAVIALHELTETCSGSYAETLRAARAKQRTDAAEGRYVPLDVARCRAALREEAPRSAGDIRAIVLDLIDGLRRRILGSATETVDLFHDGDAPKDEERCRNVLMELLGPVLPFGIAWATEERMPGGKRADAGFRLGGMRVPLEAKLAWNRSLWTAPATQLDDLYASSDHMADGNGIYVVFWFGRSVPGRPVPVAPCGTRPGSALELEGLLKGALIGGAEGRISVVVLDVERRRSMSPPGNGRQRTTRRSHGTRSLPCALDADA